MDGFKPCTGCKHLTVWRSVGYCNEARAPGVIDIDPTTGLGEYRPQWKYGLDWLENTTQRCRSQGMPCGPERRLYEPNLWRRMLGEKKSKESNG